MVTSKKVRIFISYRRVDSAGYAGRIYDRLAAHFGDDAVFMDVDTIEGGLDFVEVLENAVQSCDVLIALIGRQWLNIKDKDGNRRLDNPEDFVRIEIATALNRDIRVIPVLVDGIEMPQSTELPENLEPFAQRNALQVNHQSFNSDVYRLIEHIESALKTKVRTKRKLDSKNISILVALIALAFVLVFGLPPLLDQPENTSTPTLPITKEVTQEPTPTAIFTPPPTSFPTEITDDFGVEMMLVPAGKFTMGRDPYEELADCQEFRNDCHLSWLENLGPEHRVYLDAFYMDRYEVTNALYRDCVDAGECQQPELTSSYTRSDYFENLEFDDYPVIYVTWAMANAFCEWREARLPTEAEWEKAARGTDGRTFPWGEGGQVGCDYANLAQMCKGDTTKVGSFMRDVSPYGVYDMAGNVMEWVADWYLENYYEISPVENPHGPETGEGRVVRGGSWLNSKITQQEGKTFSRDIEHDYGSHYQARGFRCAKDATP